MRPRRHTRRDFLRSSALASAGLYLAACNGDGDTPPPSPTAAPDPTATTPALSPTPQALSWRRSETAGDLPPVRRDHSLSTDGEALYLFGGRNDTGDLNDLWMLDSDTWSPLPSDGPAPRFGHNAAWDGERLLVFGGQQGSAFFDDTWAFDGEAWQQLAPDDAPAPRYGAASAFDPDARRLLVSHGFTSSGRFDDTWSFASAGDAWNDVTPGGERPLARCLIRAVWDSIQGRLLTFGGQSNETPFMNDLWALEPGGWRQIVTDPAPPPRTFYSFVFDDEAGRAILFGGNTPDGPANDLWFFDTATETWSEQAPEGDPPSPRQGHDAVWRPRDRLMLVFGGNDRSVDLNDLWQLIVPA